MGTKSLCKSLRKEPDELLAVFLASQASKRNGSSRRILQEFADDLASVRFFGEHMHLVARPETSPEGAAPGTTSCRGNPFHRTKKGKRFAWMRYLRAGEQERRNA